MLTTPHLLTGAAVGLATGNPVAGFAAGVASHLLLDATLHTDPGTWHLDEPYPFKMSRGELALGIIDLIVAFSSVLALSTQVPLIAAAPIAGMFGGILPDIIGLSPLFFPKLATYPIMKRYHEFNKWLQWTARPEQWILGCVTQVIVIVAVVYYLLNFS